VADPLGSAMCLIFVGLFFARPLYRMGLLTIGVAIVLVYTLAGGMFSVAFIDLFQMLIIGVGMAYIAVAWCWCSR